MSFYVEGEGLIFISNKCNNNCNASATGNIYYQ